MTTKKEKSRCSKCGSTLVYLRMKEKKKVCRSCGYIENVRKPRTPKKVKIKEAENKDKDFVDKFLEEENEALKEFEKEGKII